MVRKLCGVLALAAGAFVLAPAHAQGTLEDWLVCVDLNGEEACGPSLRPAPHLIRSRRRCPDPGPAPTPDPEPVPTPDPEPTPVPIRIPRRSPSRRRPRCRPGPAPTPDPEPPDSGA